VYDELGNTKIIELQKHMERYDIQVLCIQETHGTGSCAFTTPEGYFVILSGGEPLKEGEREYAGVGFIIAPEARRSVLSYLQHSSRIAVLKLKVKGGRIAITSVYAPPATKSHD